MSETKSSQRFHSLNAEQVEVLHQVLSEVVPIHGRGNFPTLELRPRDIIMAVRARLQKQGITVRDVRLNGSTASHVLVRDNGTSYKDLDIIFGVELPSQEEFQVIKESVLGCLLDCLPAGVNRERISSATMKEAYVQKMVKVFNEHDRWSLISLSNNSGKNLELKFVSALRRQFEFSVDSFQIILDRLLESYMQQESQNKSNTIDVKDQPAENLNKDSPSPLEKATAPETDRTTSSEETQIAQSQQRDEVHEKGSQTDISQQAGHSNQMQESDVEKDDKEKAPAELKENLNEPDVSDQTSINLLSENKQASKETETATQIELRHEPEPSDNDNCSVKVEQLEKIQPSDCQQPAHSNHKELSVQKETSNHKKPPDEQKDLSEEMGKSEVPEGSNKSQSETLNLAEESHSTELSDEADFPKCFSEDEKSNESDNTRQAADTITAPPPDKVETQLEDERNQETEAGEQMHAERENNSEKGQMAEGNLVSEAEDINNTEGIDCVSSSISLTFHNTPITGTQDTAEAHSTANTDNLEKSANLLDAISPPDTQDTVPAPSSLVFDKKTSPPSSKSSERLSHMVVLKHSSPKPPRRMCRKVTPVPVSESKPVTAPTPEPNPCPSPEPETAFNPAPTAPSSGPAPATSICTKINPGLEPNPSTDVATNLDLTSDPDPTPDIVPSSAVDPMSLPQETLSSQMITEDSCETSIQSLKELPSPHAAFDEQSQSLPQEMVSTSKQSEPPDSVDMLVSHTDASNSNTQEPVHTSETELSDDDENREQWTKKMEVNEPNISLQETTVCSPSSSHSVTPPVLCLSPPCLTPSPPSLSPPPCPSPPSHCLSSPIPRTVSLAKSSNSPPLSFSPTSSCLSSPPYLTPPMLSISPPPLCLTPPSPCLSPPLLCLTPPVESDDLVPQVSSDMEPLILNPDSEKIGESSPHPRVPLLQLEDEKEQDYISSLPQVAEPASFPITIPSSTSHTLTHSQSDGPGESAPPKADEASSSITENKVTTDMTEESGVPWASGSVPAVEVLAESMYGDFEAAMDHLRYRLIATRNPEEIRGGGLLKYSNLLVRDYRPASETQIKTLERYMCSRFFIDFPDVQEQQRKILSYLKNHFIGEERSKYQYLMTLRRVVDDSTVCLMGHERRQTLNMITVLALKVLGEQNIIPNTDHVTCFYQPAPYLAEHSAPYLAEASYCSYYIPQGGSTLLYQPYPLHLSTQT